MCSDETLNAILERLNRIEAQLAAPASPYLTPVEAAAYLKIAYSTFRKRAKLIVRQPQTGNYRREDLDAFAASNRPKRKR